MNEVHCADSLTWMKAREDRSIDLIIGSPPYAEKGKRYIGGKLTRLKTQDWVLWMCELTKEAVRISRGYVIWVANGAVQNRQYLPACEGLLWECHKAGLICERPVIWHKNAPPNRKDWFGNDWEFCLAFRVDQSSALYWNWEAIGEAPKYSAGGKFRQRSSSGERREGGSYPTNPVARPRDVLRVTVGGGHLGSKLAHENEAPYPEKLVEPFIKSLCPFGGLVYDPFSGSGTTASVAIQNGRNFIGTDVRQSQVDLTNRRIAETCSRMECA
jgi:site-specific DNA-methyltransferase (adenine-specific)